MDKDGRINTALMQVPPGVRALVISNTEESAKEKGLESVTMKFFAELSAEYGMDDEVMERFRSGG